MSLMSPHACYVWWPLDHVACLTCFKGKMKMYQLKTVRKRGPTVYGMLEIPALFSCFSQSLIIDTKIENSV